MTKIESTPHPLTRLVVAQTIGPSSTVRARLLRFHVVGVLAVVGVCGCVPDNPVIDLADGTMEMAVTDPALLSETQTYVAVMFTNEEDIGCANYLDMDIETLALTRQTNASQSAAQAFTLGGEDECVDDVHVFGRVPSPGRYSYMLLGSTRPCASHFGAADDDIAAAEGSVIAIGCRDRVIEEASPVHLKITLFPAGVR